MSEERKAANEPASQEEAGHGAEAGASGAAPGSSPRRSSTRWRLLKWTVGSVVGFAVLVGLLIGVFQVVVTQVPGYRVELQDWISERTGLVVEFGTLSARLRAYGPELVFHDAIVRTPDRTHVLAAARRGALAFDAWASLGSGRLTAGRFSLDGPQIELIRTREGRIQVVGQSALPEQRAPKSFGVEQLPVGQYRVRNAHVTFRDEATGRGPWALSGVSFELDRRVDLLELEGDASLPENLGGALEFTAHAAGPLERFATLDSTFTVSGTDLDLTGWADLFPDEWTAPETGRGSLRVSGRLTGPVLSSASVTVDFANVVAVSPEWSEPLPGPLPLVHPPAVPANEPNAAALEGDAGEPSTDPGGAPPPAAVDRGIELIDYERVAFDFRAQRIADGWQLSLRDLDISRRDSPWRSEHIQAEWTHSAGALDLSGRADSIVLGNLWPLLAYLPESPALARVRALEGGGTVRDLVVRAARQGPDADLTYSLRGQLDGIRFSPVDETPGLSGISGEVRATQTGGALRLAGEAFAFDLPRLFREPLRASVNGALSWERDDEGWHVTSDELLVRNADGAATARFAMRVPADGSPPVLDLTAQARDIAAAATRKYLPAGRLREKSVEWLDNAFVHGMVPQAEFVYRGPLKGFPFRNGEGLFRVRGRVEGLTFVYQPRWMPAHDIAAEFEFRNQGLEVHSGTGTVGGLHLQDGAADIADFKEMKINVHAEGRGDLQHGLDYLHASPLAPALGAQFAKLSGSGDLQARVDLHLPLKNKAERSVEVHASLDTADVHMQDLDAPLTALTGTLTVHHTGLQAADLRGNWLGGPVTVQVERPDTQAVPSDTQAIPLLVAEGSSNAAEILPLLYLPPTVTLDGAADWRVEMPLAGKEGPQQFALESDLRGFAIGLPEPVGKQAREARRLRVELEFENASRALGRIAFGDIRGLLRMRRTDEGWRLDRGSIRPDGRAAALPDHSGLRLEGTLDRFKLDDWLALRDPAASGESRLSDYLRAANMRIGKLELFGYEWSDVRGLLHATPNGWRVNVAGPMAEGELTVPYDLTGGEPLAGKFERLSLVRPASDDDAEEALARVRDPRNLPAVAASVQEMQVGSAQLGAMELKVARVQEGVRVDTLTVSGASFQGSASGHWLRTEAGDDSRLDARFVSTDVAATLRAVGYTGFMEAKHGEILANLSWSGGFDREFLGRASGTLSVSADNGQLLNLQPGAGRLLGLLSVAALPRRLALDFSDLTDEGLSFDSVHGDFELREGDAYTRNLLLRGPAAEIGIAGRTGLGTQDYDQTAVVTGNLGASLPVAGALAGGPAVGAALLLFSQMFKEPLKGITRGYYRITGSWDDPVVERVGAAEIKEASVRNFGP